jgi:hypothetical protein
VAVDKSQLEFAEKLNETIEAVTKASEKLEKSLETQISLMEKLASAAQKVDFSKQKKSAEELNDINLEKLKKSIEDTSSVTKTAQDQFKKVSTQLEKKFPVAAALSVGALSGLYQGFRNIVAISKSSLSFLSSFAGGLFNVGAAIIAIPLKIFTGLVDMAAAAGGGMNELALALEHLRKEFGALTGPTPKTVIEMSTTLKGFSDTGLSAWRVFGNLAERIEAFTKLAVAMGASFQRLTKELQSNGGAILAYQKGLGVADDQMAAFAQRALVAGDKLADVMKDTAKYALEMYDLIYTNQTSWSNASNSALIFEGYATQLGLNTDTFKSDYASEEVNAVINADLNEGKGLNISGTPTFYLNGRLMQDSERRSYDEMVKAIDAEIAKVAPAPTNP